MPEAIKAARALDSRQPEQEVREALTALGRAGQVRFWRGRWDREDEHVEVPAGSAALLLEEPRWYRFRLDERDEERLYYVNVDNIASGDG